MTTDTTAIPEIDNLAWTDERPIQDGKYWLKSADPNEGFWNLYREYKQALSDAGISISKFGGRWQVNWWKKDGEYRYPVIEGPSVSEMLELKPLVNEKDILPYQKPLVQQTVAAMAHYGCSLNGCTTGVGKTYITLASVRESGRRLLVICPKGITPDWIRAAHFMGVKLAGAFGWEWIKTGKTDYGHWEYEESVKNGKTVKKRGDFVWTLPADCDICFDEVHRASGIDTQNAHIVLRAKAQGIRIYTLSATIANDPTKMNAIGYVLGLHQGGRDFYSWMTRHGVQEIEFKVGRRMVKTYKFKGTVRHLQAIHSAIFPQKGCRVRADQLGDQFPATQILAKAYEMDEDRAINKAYAEMQDRVEEIMHERMSASEKQANILVEILRARQKVELLKVPLFCDLYEDFREEGNSVFIAVNFKDTMKELVERLKLKAVIVGGQKEHERRNAIDDFQANKVPAIIGIIKACREGLNLHDIHGGHPRASLIMPTPSAFDLKQVLGRVHRAGGKTPSLQRIVFAANTIEEEVCRSLATKLDQLDILMDGDLQTGIFPDSYSSMRPDKPDAEEEEPF